MKTKVFTDGFEGHRRRSLKRNAKRAKGEPLRPEKVITFADPLDMMECLTTPRVEIHKPGRSSRVERLNR